MNRTRAGLLTWALVVVCITGQWMGRSAWAEAVAGSLIYDYDVARFYAKVSQDMRESQLESGLVPDIAPAYTVFSNGFRDSPEWGSACIFNP